MPLNKAMELLECVGLIPAVCETRSDATTFWVRPDNGRTNKSGVKARRSLIDHVRFQPRARPTSDLRKTGRGASPLKSTSSSVDSRGVGGLDDEYTRLCAGCAG
jgi:hypothetical protein